MTNPLAVWSRAFKQVGHFSGVCNHGKTLEPCAGGGTAGGVPCNTTEVLCAETGAAMVSGPITAESLGSNGRLPGSKAGSSITVGDCYKHLPDMGNSWPVIPHTHILSRLNLLSFLDLAHLFMSYTCANDEQVWKAQGYP
eukprot:SAG22_NODE_2382_length_2632_cov_1.309514_3_plen_139_part_01